MSSIKMIHFVPTGGPNIPRLLLISLFIIISCVKLADVWAEKLINDD